MNAIETITKQIAPLFAEQDAQIADRDVAWALERRAAVREFVGSAEWKALSFDQKYARAFDLAGGKTFYRLFQGSSAAMVEDFMRKNAAATAEKRNARIAEKLAKAGVSEIVSAEVGYCKDGFNGVWRINGDRVVTIQSILAGGYNIQRLHQRVLVKVK